jgi:hypothetical protein
MTYRIAQWSVPLRGSMREVEDDSQDLFLRASLKVGDEDQIEAFMYSACAEAI